MMIHDGIPSVVTISLDACRTRADARATALGVFDRLVADHTRALATELLVREWEIDAIEQVVDGARAHLFAQRPRLLEALDAAWTEFQAADCAPAP